MSIKLKCGITLMSVLLFSKAQAFDFSGDSSPQVKADSLPEVFNDRSDVLHALYRHKALNQSKKHQVPFEKKEWEAYREELRKQIIDYSGTKLYTNLPLAMRETGSYKGEDFVVRNIYFQTQPGVFATANLYVPEGNGPFPAVVVMMGHSSNGKLYNNYQQVGQSLAKEGYVALAIDPWGAGERSSLHDEFEYHGAELGASLYNIGESLLGMQLTDNIRAVDLLTSLPFVDKNKIGATGASGGGNQTMWLAAIDERVKAALPVVSVGTFESYIMAHNCVCEVLPQGLTASEEWAVLGLVAPRAIKMCNHKQESNPTFFPAEMLKSYEKAQPIFALHEKEGNISYDFFDRPHGYYPEDREALLGWLDLHLKGVGDGKPRKEKLLTLIDEDKLMVFPKGKRPKEIQTTESYNRQKGIELKLKTEKEFTGDLEGHRKQLKKVLIVHDDKSNVTLTTVGKKEGWERIIMETHDGKILAVLLKRGSGNEYDVLAHAEGKRAIPFNILQNLNPSKNIVVIDFSGAGEAGSSKSEGFDKRGRAHTYGRAALWLGETMIGNWVTELTMLTNWLKENEKAKSITFHGFKEAGIAGIFAGAINANLNEIHTYETPASYLFDSRKGAEHFGVGVHIPGILKWGDISKAAALAETALYFHKPVSISGNSLTSLQKKATIEEYARMKKKSGLNGKVNFD